MINNPTNSPKRWLSPKDLQKEYGFSLSTQSKLRMNRKIPYSKINKKVFYCRFTIDKWIEDNRVDTIA